MKAKNEAQCSVVNLDDITLPSRSQLYSLSPIVGGRFGTESIISYGARLSHKHNLRFRVVAGRIILAEMDKKYLTYDKRKGRGRNVTSFFKIQQLATVGLGSTAEQFLHAWQKCTGRTDLRELTLLSFPEKVSVKELIEYSKKWCAQCFYEMGKEDLYEPAIWLLKVTRVCPHHGVRLENRCHHCGQIMKLMPIHYHIGYCSHCHKSLAEQRRGERKVKQPGSLDDQWEFWSSHAAHQFFELSRKPDSRLSLHPERFGDFVSLVIEQLFEGNISAASQHLGINTRTLYLWMSHKSRPTMPNFFKTIYCFLDSPLDYFEGSNNKIQKVRHPLFSQKPRQLHPRRTEEGLLLELRKLMKLYPNGEKSGVAIAREMNYDRGRLGKLFPKEMEKLMAKNTAYLEAIRKARYQDKLNEVIGYIESRYKLGRIPSRREVGLQTGLPFFQPWESQCYKEALEFLAEKGISPSSDNLNSK